MAIVDADGAVPATAEGQYAHLLTLLARHGAKLPSATRAQHLKVAGLLLGGLSLSASAATLPHALASLSAYHGACKTKKSGETELDDEEPALVALFSLVASACGCAGADKSYELARRPSEAVATEPFAEVGGLFGGAKPPQRPMEGPALPAAFGRPGGVGGVQRSLQSAHVDVHGAAAHLIAAACDVASNQRGVRVRAAALAALCALVRALPVGLLAAFFPGVASAMVKMLPKCRLMQSALVVLIVDGLGVGVARLFPTKMVLEPAGVSPFASLVESLGDSLPTDPVKRPTPCSSTAKRARSLSVDRDAGWYASSSANLCALLGPALASADGPASHQNAIARAALAPFLALVALRDSALAVSADLRWRCVFLLAEAVADEFPDVRAAAVGSLRKGSAAETLENALRALVGHVGRLPAAMAIARGAVAGDGGGDENELADGPDGEAAKTLAEMFPISDPAQRWTGAFRGLLLAVDEKGDVSALKRLDMDAVAVALVALQDATWTPSALGAPKDYALMRTPALDACRSLGAAGLLPQLHAPLLEIAERQRLPVNPLADDDDVPAYPSSAAMVRHGHACLCLQALTMGAVTLVEPDLPRPQLERFSSAALAAVAQVVLPDDADDTRLVRAKTMALMCAAELCDALRNGVRDSHTRALDQAAALPVLLPLLADAASDRPEIATAAEHSLEALAAATGAGSAQRLVRRHANFLVARLVRMLHTRESARVLRHVVASGSASVSDRVVALAEAALARRCDDLAGASDAAATAALAALQAVLGAAPPFSTAEPAKGQPNAAEKERRDAARILAAFRTEEYAPGEAETGDIDKDDDGNRPFHDDDLTDAQRDAARTPFQRLAIRAAAGAGDLLVGRPAPVRAVALRTAFAAVRALADDRRALLPVAANLLPLLPAQLSVGAGSARGLQAVQRVNALGESLPVVAGACALLAGLARTARGFVRSRFVRAVYPELRVLVRLLNEPERPSQDAETPSPAALAAADAALDAVAAVAETVPDALAPFADELLDAVLAYVRGEPPVAREDPRERRRRKRWIGRAEAAGKIVAGLAGAEPDRTWAALVAVEGSRCVRHWEDGASRHELRVR